MTPGFVEGLMCGFLLGIPYGISVGWEKCRKFYLEWEGRCIKPYNKRPSPPPPLPTAPPNAPPDPHIIETPFTEPKITKRMVDGIEMTFDENDDVLTKVDADRIRVEMVQEFTTESGLVFDVYLDTKHIGQGHIRALATILRDVMAKETVCKECQSITQVNKLFAHNNSPTQVRNTMHHLLTRAIDLRETHRKLLNRFGPGCIERQFLDEGKSFEEAVSQMTLGIYGRS